MSRDFLAWYLRALAIGLVVVEVAWALRMVNAHTPAPVLAPRVVEVRR